ncbi:MAG: low molecular weight phosphatase family protein [Bacillota bacterium]
MIHCNQVLFLCTGNYYRSRFAEILFNQLPSQASIPWMADSRALNITAGRNVGPISPYAIEGLRARGILLPPVVRFPKQVSQEDLRSSARIIAMNEQEHRPLIESTFPQWTQHVEYWHVHDLDLSSAEEALAEIERCVRDLAVSLHQATTPAGGSNRSGPSYCPGKATIFLHGPREQIS